MNKCEIYTVPDFSPKEISAYLSDIGITTDSGEILKPSPASALRIYESLLEFFSGPAPAAEDESVHIIQTVQRMGILLERIGMPGFTVKDLSPDYKRFISLLSAIVNFGMFRDNKRRIYERVGEMADANFVAKKQLESRIEALREETESALNDLSRNGEQAVALEAEIQALENELKNLYKQQKEKTEEVAFLKREKGEFGDRLCAMQLAEHNLKQEIACLKTQLVSDPTRLMELVGEMRQLAENERESARAAEESIGNNNQRLAKQQRHKEMLCAVVRLGKAAAEATAKGEELSQESVMIESQLKAWDSRINALKIRTNHVERQISHLQSKIYGLQTKDKSVSEEISGKIANLRIKYDAVSTERNKMMEQVQENNRNVQDIILQNIKMTGEHEKEMLEVVSGLVQLSGRIDAYFSEVSSYLG